MSKNNIYIFDKLTELKDDAGAITASAAAQVATVNQILDMGERTYPDGELASYFEADIVLDISAIDFGTGDETYQILVQGSNSSTFASGVVNMAATVFGDAVNGANDDVVVGRRVLHVNNEVADVRFRFLRLFSVLGGTSPSITYAAYLTKPIYR